MVSALRHIAIFVPDSAKRNIDLWAGWIAGALLEAELATAISDAGFKDFAITWQGDIFRDAPQQTSAAAFGTVGITYRARKTTR
jgi:hypothetical protein